MHVGLDVKASTELAMAVGIAIIVLALALHVNAMTSLAPLATTSSTTTIQISIPTGLSPGCYVGTQNPFTITQVPCDTNLPPMGGIGT